MFLPKQSMVESGSDDLDNPAHLGHLLMGQWVSPANKLSGCDQCFLLDHVFIRMCMALASGRQTNFGSGEGEICTELSML